MANEVNLKKGLSTVEKPAMEDGSILIEKDSGRIYLDDDGTRYQLTKKISSGSELPTDGQEGDIFLLDSVSNENDDAYNTIYPIVNEHMNDYDNPHEVTCEQIGATYNNRNAYNVTSDEDVVAALNTEYALTPDNGRRNFVLVDNVGSTYLSGGIHHITIRRADSLWGSAEAVIYKGSDGYKKFSRNFYNGEWLNWQREDSSYWQVNGRGKTVSQSLYSVGWYRVGKITAYGHTGSFLITTGGSFNYRNVDTMNIVATTTYGGGNFFLITKGDGGGVGAAHDITGIRLNRVPNSNVDFYVDVYYSFTGAVNNCHVTVTPISGYCELVNLTPISNIDDYSCAAAMNL